MHIVKARHIAFGVATPPLLSKREAKRYGSGLHGWKSLSLTTTRQKK